MGTITVVRNVHVVVPAFLHEVDRLATCVVLSAVLVPVLCVSRRHMQVDRLTHHPHRHGSDQDRFRVDQLRWWQASDVDTTIEAGLADADRYADISSDCCTTEGYQRRHRAKEAFHCEFLFNKTA